MLTSRQHVDKSLALIAFLEQLLEISFFGDARVQRGVDTTNQRREVRHKGQADIFAGSDRQPLTDFWQMAVARHTVGLEVIAGFGKQGMYFSLTPGTRHARFGIGYQRAHFHYTRLDQRQETQLHGGGVAPRVGD